MKVPGVIKLRGDRRLLLVDYDGRPEPFTAIARLLQRLALVPEWIRYDRTRRGWHLVAQLPIELTSGELVALQLLAGSDREREIYNLRRVICGARPRDWNLLFDFKLQEEPPNEHEKQRFSRYRAAARRGSRTAEREIKYRGRKDRRGAAFSPGR